MSGAVNFIDKLDFVYELSDSGKTTFVDLPCKLLIVGAFSNHAYAEEESWKTYKLPSHNINKFLESINLLINLRVANFLYPCDKLELAAAIPIGHLDDLSPSHLLKNVLHLDKAYKLLATLKFYINDNAIIHDILSDKEHLKFFDLAQEDIASLDFQQLVFLLSDFEKRIFQQLDVIIKHERFKEVEANWYGLKTLLHSVDEDKNYHIDLLDVSKSLMLYDSSNNNVFYNSQLYNSVYTQELGQFGGIPYSAIIGTYEFDATTNDIEALHLIAQVAAAAHAPFIAAVSPQMWSMDSYREFVNPSQLSLPKLSRSSTAKWQSLAQSPAAKYIFLTVPKILLREAYHYGKNDTGGLQFIENNTNGSGILWGSSAFCIAQCLLLSFIKYKSGLGITAEHGCSSDLGVPALWLDYESNIEFMKQGFVPLFYKKEQQQVLFYAIPAVSAITQKETVAESAQDLGKQLLCQLPYLMLVSRVVHYLRVIQRDSVGTNDIQVIKALLNEWLSKYVSDMEDPEEKTRIKKPLRNAEVDVFVKDPDTQELGMTLTLKPHMPYYGKQYSLSVDSDII